MLEGAVLTQFPGGRLVEHFADASSMVYQLTAADSFLKSQLWFIAKPLDV